MVAPGWPGLCRGVGGKNTGLGAGGTHGTSPPGPAGWLPTLGPWDAPPFPPPRLSPPSEACSLWLSVRWPGSATSPRLRLWSEGMGPCWRRGQPVRIRKQPVSPRALPTPLSGRLALMVSFLRQDWVQAPALSPLGAPACGKFCVAYVSPCSSSDQFPVQRHVPRWPSRGACPRRRVQMKKPGMVSMYQEKRHRNPNPHVPPGPCDGQLCKRQSHRDKQDPKSPVRAERGSSGRAGPGVGGGRPRPVRKDSFLRSIFHVSEGRLSQEVPAPRSEGASDGEIPATQRGGGRGGAGVWVCV